MKMKGWPFEPLDNGVTPCERGNGAGPLPMPG